MAYTLMDYVKGGCSLKLIVAIDFTVSDISLSLRFPHYVFHLISPCLKRPNGQTKYRSLAKNNI